MKWRNPLAMVVLAIITTAVATAQPSIVSVAVPPPGQYGIEELWNVTLQNPDTTTYEVWLEGTITEATKGQVFWAKTNKFQLQSGQKVIKYRDIQSIGIERQTHAKGYEQFAARTGGLPAGDYTFLVRLEPGFDTGSVRFDVRPSGAPRLVSPRDGDTIRIANPQFVWTPPSPAPRGRVTYEFKLVEVRDRQTPEEAMRANPPWFEQKGITATSLTYPTSARAIETEDMPPHKAYAWRVTAMTGGGAGVASEAAWFAMGVEQDAVLDTSLWGPVVEWDSAAVSTALAAGVVVGPRGELWAMVESSAAPMIQKSVGAGVSVWPTGVHYVGSSNSFYIGACLSSSSARSGWLRVEGQHWDGAKYVPENCVAVSTEPYVSAPPDAWIGRQMTLGDKRWRFRGRLKQVKSVQPPQFNYTYSGWSYFYPIGLIMGFEQFTATRKPFELWAPVTLEFGPASLPMGSERHGTPMVHVSHGEAWVQSVEWAGTNTASGRFKVTLKPGGGGFFQTFASGTLRWFIFYRK